MSTKLGKELRILNSAFISIFFKYFPKYYSNEPLLRPTGPSAPTSATRGAENREEEAPTVKFE